MTMLRKPGQPNLDMTRAELELWLQAALTEKDGDIAIAAPDLARIVRSHLRCENDLSEVRAAARREIIRVQNRTHAAAT